MTDKGLFGIRGEDTYQISDDQWVLEFYADHQNDSGEALARAVCSNEKMWGEDLTSLPGFAEAVAGYLGDIEKNGMYAAMKAVCGLE